MCYSSTYNLLTAYRLQHARMDVCATCGCQWTSTFFFLRKRMFGFGWYGCVCVWFLSFIYLEGRCPEAVSKPSIRTHQALNCGRDFRSRIVFTSRTVENRLVPQWREYRAGLWQLSIIHRLFRLRRNLRLLHFWEVLRQPLPSVRGGRK